jgi:hypothetical protein
LDAPVMSAVLFCNSFIVVRFVIDMNLARNYCFFWEVYLG